MTPKEAWLTVGGIFFGLAAAAMVFIAYTTGQYQALLYGAFPLALAVVMFKMAKKESRT